MSLVKKVYADSSVFGGINDEEFRTPSKNFFNQVKLGLFVLSTSALVQKELQLAPEVVRKEFDELLNYAEILDITHEALRLQKAYLDAKILTTRWSNDALHVAIASVSSCDIIVSWNFRHIVHYDKIPLYNAINILHGYKPIAIYSPLEVIRYEKE